MTVVGTSIILQGKLAVYVWLLMCDGKLNNTFPDIVRCSSRKLREVKMRELIH